ncbi:hypothetical protein CsSME_00053057 [Camellia sinensis var. sinensis]
MIIKKSILNIQLIERPMSNNSNKNQSTDSNHLGNKGKGLIINTILLQETLGNQQSFISLERTIRMGLDFIDPFATNRILADREGNQCPSVSLQQGKQLIFHSLYPIRILTGLLVSLRFCKRMNSRQKNTIESRKICIRPTQPVWKTMLLSRKSVSRIRVFRSRRRSNWS